jgi:antitoxin ParD1/3/4
MSNVAKVSITLTQEMAALIATAVETGEYATTSEVIREALREWNLRRSVLQQEREHIQKLWAEGIASGPGRFKDIEDIKAVARRRLTAETPASGN